LPLVPELFDMASSLTTPLLTVTQAAGVLNCSEQHIRNMIRRGRLRAINIGVGRQAEYRVTQQGLEDVLAPLQAPVSQPPRRGRSVSPYKPKILRPLAA
jgi:excisionase family DNA binding protein